MDRKRADRRQFHYIYKITRFDGKYYIGLHSTDDLDDGYFGSGKYIRNSINYHGLEKHTKEILEFLPNRASLRNREAQIVNEECLNDPLCMNLKLGGEGGWDHVNKNKDEEYYRIRKETRKVCGIKNIKKLMMFLNELPKEKRHEIAASGGRISGKITGFYAFKDKKHTEETKLQIGKSNSLSQLGTKNSQFGTKWITDGKINKKISANEPLPEHFRYGRSC